MKEEHLSIDCPYCSKEITFDDNGNPVAINQEPLPPLSHRGLGGLISQDVTDWRGPHNYQRNSQYEPPSESLGNLPDLNAEHTKEMIPDEAIETAIVQDLSKRGLNNEETNFKQNN